MAVSGVVEICHNVLGVKKVFHKCGKYLLAHTEKVSASWAFLVQIYLAQ